MPSSPKPKPSKPKSPKDIQTTNTSVPEGNESILNLSGRFLLNPPLSQPPHQHAWTRETRLAPNFKLGEFLHAGSFSSNNTLPSEGILWSLWLLAQRLQTVRDLLQRPITITSGYRTPEHNKAIGGHPLSYHLRGMAADIVVAGLSPKQVQQKLSQWNGGLGCYATFTHVDIGPKRRWGQ